MPVYTQYLQRRRRRRRLLIICLPGKVLHLVIVKCFVLSVQYLPNSKILIMYEQVQLRRLLQIPAYKFLLASANDSLQRVQTYT
jgi:hypothetical protein